MTKPLGLPRSYHIKHLKYTDHHHNHSNECFIGVTVRHRQSYIHMFPFTIILLHLTSLYNEVILLKQLDNLTTPLKTSSSTRLLTLQLMTKY